MRARAPTTAYHMYLSFAGLCANIVSPTRGTLAHRAGWASQQGQALLGGLSPAPFLQDVGLGTQGGVGEPARGPSSSRHASAYFLPAEAPRIHRAGSASRQEGC